MNSFESSSNDSEILNENSLPVELQTKNVTEHKPVFGIPAMPATNGPINGSLQAEPYVVISEQPQQRGFRFRYECEGPSHGGLQGTKSERGRKSYPSIKIGNYSGAARVVVSLVTDEKNPRAHAHKLVGTNCKNGLCTTEIKTNVDVISFPNLCILHVTRKKLVDVLTERILDSIKLTKKLKANNMNFEPPVTDEDKKTAKSQAEEQSKSMQLNVVCLCFQVFLRNPDGSFSKMLPSVVSQPIYDSKSPGASALKICRMDKYGGCCSGNEEVFLLCEKVQKDDIQVKFVEQNPDGSVNWEAYGNFGPLDVHRQYAIVFKTPAYWNTNIDKAVNVLIMLQRKSDQEVSEPKAFTYFPQNRDKDNIASKKRKRIPLDGYDFGGGDGGLGGASMGGEGGSGGQGSSSGDGGGGGGGVVAAGGNGRGNNVSVMLLATGELRTQMGALPTTVEEVIKEEYETNIHPSASELLQIQNQGMYSPRSSEPDLWTNQDDSDIEVDSAVLASLQKIKEESKLSGPQIKGSTSSPKHRSPHPSPPSPNGSSRKGGGGATQGKSDRTKLTTDSSPDWLDSGVDPGTSKSVSLEERKLVMISEGDADKQSGSNTTADALEDRDDTKTGKSSSGSDYHSEPDTKVDGVSEGIRSDEGFSETSEEMALKGQQVSPAKAKCETLTSAAKELLPNSQLAHAVRHVTSRVAERTLTALTDFAETGDIRHLLLVQRHLLAVSNKNGDLPLHLAVINAQSAALKALLDVMSTLPESKRHINSFNLLRQTSLHLATVMQQDQMVEMLLHAGADPSIADRNGNTAAHLAVINKSSSCLKTLVKYLRPGQSQADPFPELNYLNYDGYSPIHLAAQAGSVDMLNMLVFGRADVDLPDGKSGKTALHHAVDNNDLPVAEYLLMEARTDVNARCFDGNTALHIACARQLVGMVALLVMAGADQECENEEIPNPEIGGDEGGMIDRRGLKPVDYADENEQILKLLYGEIGSETDEHRGADSSLTSRMSQMSIDKTSLTLSGCKSLTGIMSNDSGVDCIESAGHGDMSAVSSRTRIELSRRLDPPSPGQDVLALAEKLGYSQLVHALEGIRMKMDTSPTTFLLEYFETDEGSVAKLRAGLLAIGREDAATLMSQ